MFYIGRFPGAIGGVTIKNELIYEELSSITKIDKFDTEVLKKNKIKGTVQLIQFIYKNRSRSGFIGVSNKSLIMLLNIINIITPTALKNIKVFVMGGNLHKYINSGRIIKILKSVNVLYVEVEKMKEELGKLGIRNVEVIPNCRKLQNDRALKTNSNSEFKFLFLSRISLEKGVNIILESNKLLKERNFTIDFYGPIDEAYEKEFINDINKSSNMIYCGQVNSNKINIYELISKYDCLLFPTLYKGEGFPGILAESKIAGIPSIVSDWNYNSDIVKNGFDGIVLTENTSECLANEMEKLINDKEQIEILRLNAYNSGENFLINKYLNTIIDFENSN
ncbi:glycosyltransferase [Clostridium sp.]|uniref:glycosyltransferase n=1 Tax=Clostridium sp. TaxID=1506 RepID=UPI00291285C9|nr:glycosyltransferase [Clostridium sp.]MDU7215710.1 glycosyltransferase [Clostridium sp.]